MAPRAVAAVALAIAAVVVLGNPVSAAVLCSQCARTCGPSCGGRSGEFFSGKCSGVCNTCEICKSDVLRTCSSNCMNGCGRSCSWCDCRSTCSTYCDAQVVSYCKSTCESPPAPSPACNTCITGEINKCFGVCDAGCKKDCVTG